MLSSCSLHFHHWKVKPSISHLEWVLQRNCQMLHPDRSTGITNGVLLVIINRFQSCITDVNSSSLATYSMRRYLEQHDDDTSNHSTWGEKP